MSNEGTWSNSQGLPGIKRLRVAADLFDGSTTSVFTITGGKVYILMLTMEVSAGALDATGNNVQFVANPTTGSSVDLCAILDVASDEEGTIYSITGTLADALVGTTAGAVAGMAKPIMINTGTIDLVSSGDSNNTNSALQSVEIIYIPIDSGALLVTA